MKKLVIEVKANEGATRDANRHVPFTPEEIARDAERCAAAGASLIHFHARGADGAADHSPQANVATVAAIRERCDVLALPAAANVPGARPAQRIANVVDSGAELLGVEMGPVSLGDRLLANDAAAITYFLAAAERHALTPYLVAFDVPMLREIERRALAAPTIVGLILGGPDFPAAHPATLRGLEALLDFLPGGVEWIACAHGANALAIAAAAIERGGHVGIGLGDHPYRELGEPDNAALVARVAALARCMGRAVATPGEARELLGVG